jgi:hypothetical protein
VYHGLEGHELLQGGGFDEGAGIAWSEVDNQQQYHEHLRWWLEYNWGNIFKMNYLGKDRWVLRSWDALLTAVPHAHLHTSEAVHSVLACPLTSFTSLSTGLALAAGLTFLLPWT